MTFSVRALCFCLAASCGGFAQEMPSDRAAAVDAAVTQIVAKAGLPGASVGIVQDGRIVYTKAFGDARLQPELKASAAMVYPVGSISKQITATCILLLQEDGKLTLDDTVSKWFPELTRASEVTLREVLSHTSGYEDYAPQDYTIPLWTKPRDPLSLVDQWAGKPLDFDPGSQWQYSNTNFVLAALIVEKASGMPYFDFLEQRVLKPLGMNDALNLDTDRERLEVRGYERHALGPLRPAILEAPGWYFGAASLAMPVADLLKWDIAMMNRSLLKPGSYDAFETDVKLNNGKPAHYGLGISVSTQDGHLVLEHSGEVGGFVAENEVRPDEKLAIAVLTNQEASTAASEIAAAVESLLEGKPAAEAPEVTQLRTILGTLQSGTIDRRPFTPDANFYFSAETVQDFAASLGPLGAVTEVKKQRETPRGGMVFREFSVGFAGGDNVTVTTYTMPDGKLEQLLVERKN